MQKTAKYIIFSGRVQGVGFRFTTLRFAEQFNLSGYVKNQPDGTVAMLAQGNITDINECIHEIKTYFKRYITKSNEIPRPLNPEYNDFRITY